ncbi:SET domain-containing protein-lysine N-methyltransferase [Okeania sp.]|uniref:SET domain-containing protein-lysine N-methyltransferase n=1 Tax=Okeania sp. TaxID=3100323 RepID=UPI002B4AE8DE|nr:SET domain-containing protein-lysine N-methyltransferase [Okeania sp.]MEB3339679.1 SET domain-containing protein-lysine N-methyltransferase [Okeania sp.]
MIKVQKIQNKGRGIFAVQDIPKGTLLEVAPTVILPPEQLQTLNQTKVLDYYFVQPSEYATAKKIKGYLVLGLASLCNHGEDPNSYVEWIEDEVCVWSHLITKKDIKNGEEVTLFYTNINEYPDGGTFV